MVIKRPVISRGLFVHNLNRHAGEAKPEKLTIFRMLFFEKAKQQ